jgi:CubicO group peptidase (beta-lactamase class C family)
VPRSLPRSAPADQQVSSAAVLAFVDALDAQPDVEMHSVMVLRHGHVLAEGWWAPYSAERPQLIYSLSKIFTCTAAGFAAAEGLLDLDDSIVKHFPEFDADIVGPSRAITLRHAITMASGHTREMRSEAFVRDPHEPIRGLLLIRPDSEPGTVFAYSQPCTYAVASVIQRNAGMPLTQYLRPRLFDPLGIGQVGWLTAPPGREQGFSGLFARTEDIAKLGQVYLQHGRWGNAQLLSADWVAEATSRQIATPNEPNPDWQRGYGFQFWLSQHGYRGDGAFGQFCVVLPEQDTVVVTTASTDNMQAILDALWTHLLPGLGTTMPDAGAAQQALAGRLASLRLPACAAEPAPADWQPWTAKAFDVTVPADKLEGAPALTSVELSPTADGRQVCLDESVNSLTVCVGNGQWQVSAPTDSRGDTIPVAASGGWLDGETARVEIIFLETPHRLDITCRLRDRIADVAWRQAPLGDGRLESLHCPR